MMIYPSYPNQQSPTSDHQPIAPSSWQLIKQSLVNFGKRAIAYFTQEPEPIISQRTDAKNQTFWRIYDPHTGQSTTCQSVAEVRAWLESRYSWRHYI